MAVNSYHKILSSQAPNLSLQNNAALRLLWGTAGVLGGLTVTSVVPSVITPGPSSFDIALSPGSFVHAGLTVEYPEGALITLAFPTTPSLTDPIYLIATSNGVDAGSAPSWSLISASGYRAQPDFKNFAAVIAIYRLQMTPNQIVQQVGFDADISVAWAPVPALPVHVPPYGHFSVLNGSASALPNFVLSGVASPVDVIGIQNLGSNAASVSQVVLTSIVSVNRTGATQSINGTVTVGGGAILAFERFSMFANGVEAFFVAVGGETSGQVADKLRLAALAAWPTIAVPDGAGPALVTFTSAQYGQAGNYDLRATTTSAAATLVAVQPSGAVQSSILVEFPAGASGIAADPITIYPPVPLPPTLIGVAGPPVAMSFQVALNNISASTFNSLRLRITAQGGGTVNIGPTFLTLSVSELNLAIDPAPPTQLSHWVNGPVVSVGGGDGTSLQAHRLSDTIDHADRSIPGIKLKTRTVGALELSQFVIGAGFSGDFYNEGRSPTDDLTKQPWIIAPDLNLSDCSFVLKRIAQALGDLTGGTQNLVLTFSHDHNASGGHHRAATSADITTPNPDGMRVLQLLAGDSVIDGQPLPPGWASVVTQGQTAILADAVGIAKSTLLSSRKAAGVPIAAGGTDTVRDFVIASPEQAAAAPGKIGLAIGMDVARPHITAAYKDEDAKPFSGISSLDNIPIQGLINNQVTLFEGWVVFVRVDQAGALPNWAGRIGGPGNTRFFADTAMTGASAANADATGSINDQSKSFLPDSPSFGAAYYADFGSPNNFLSGTTAEVTPVNSVAGIDALLNKISTGLGYFPTPVKNAGATYTTLDVGSGSEWFYLPFPKKDIFGSVSVEANIFSLSGNSRPDGVSTVETGADHYGLQLAPAYDAREVILTAPYNLTVPTYASGTGAFRSKSTGTVRRHPWVLTPYGMGRRIGFSGGTDDSYFYNPSLGGVDGPYDPYAFFTRPLTDYVGTFARSTNFLSGNIASNDSYVIRGALPFYDRRRAADGPVGNAAGVAINAAQVNCISGIQRSTSANGSADDRTYLSTSCGGTVSLMNRYAAQTIPYVDSTKQAIVNLGGGSARTPDGIAICTHRWDFGIAGKNLQTAGVPPYNQGSPASAFVEVPIAIHLKITGTVLDRLKLSMAL